MVVPSTQSVGGTVSMEQYQALLKENAELKEKEVKHVDTIRQLKTQLDFEKKGTRNMRAEKVNIMTQRNELEEFFL